MIEQILNPIIKPIKRKIIAPLKRAKTLPKRALAVIRRWLVTAIFGPLRSLNNYLRVGSYFIAKKLIALILIITLFIVYFGFISPPAFINKWFGRTPQLEASAAADKGFTGPASIMDADGNLLFKGQLENGQYTGNGKLFFPDGKLRYQGDFAKGMMEGAGELYTAEGILLYRGAFAADQYSGAGTLFYPDGQPKYEGLFLAGAYEGAGTAFAADGSMIYSGAFLKGVFSGDGKLYSGKDKLLYEGQFNNGIYEGAGKQFDGNGVLLYEGNFLAGKLSGPAKEYFPSGFVKYDGAFLLGSYHGAGSLFNETGSTVYVGSFANGVQNGSGQAFNAAGGVVYDGKFVNGKYEGVGTLFDADGAPLYKGFFRQGNLYAEGFISLSLVKLQETLGAPDAPVLPLEEEPLEDGTVIEGTLPDDASDANGSVISPLPSAAPTATDQGAIQPSATPTATDQGAIQPSATPEASAVPSSSPTPNNEVQTLSASNESVTIADIATMTDAPASDSVPPIEGEIGEEVILPQTLTFSAMQLSFVLEVDVDNPEAFYVQRLTTWNPVIMEQTYSRLLAAKTVSAKEQLENGRTNLIFKSGTTLLTFLMNKNKPVRLEMSSILTGSE
ncbi:antitoxin component YwqK of YwqJK toxin-antitoxin module [Paenibacillus endophyticus]|uniref:Antitoxin component YwqK of YwqJK toxin-antitoxin module n=1 Tax=Paenibacillus endophyticus TaxID=1294268 RepID=A0A7W5C2D1_9BACL|nr:hypothetical protein [Paenibacillus endophyticus]MBB3149971.1 antitoxin component YwqK of YwqJK toxin-antitoxin module [Paenibacillus endophyticus]